MALLARSRGGGRRGRTRVGVVLGTVGTLLAFQALAVIGAPGASAAVVTCDVTGTTLSVSVNGANTFSLDGLGQIYINGALTNTFGGTCGTSLPRNLANTTAINITGPAGVSPTDETVTIQMEEQGVGTAGVDWGTINWTINLGDDGAAGDALTVDNALGTDPVTVDFGASGIDLNADGDLDVTFADVELFTANGGSADDTINAGGSTATGAAFPSSITIAGGAGDDTLTGGAAGDAIDGDAGDDTLAGGLGNDTLDGDTENDTVDYSASTTAVSVNLEANTASGEGLDSVPNVENVIGSAQGDTLTGANGEDNVITPGAGDDTVNGGNGGDSDTVDYSDATAAVTVDLDAGTATGGSGNDSLTSIENAQGSDFDDTLSGDGGDNGLFGGPGNDTLAGAGNAGDGGDGDVLEGQGGIDTADYGWSADPVSLVLNCLGADGTGDYGLDTDVIRTMENAILTADDDSFTGNEFANRVWPNGGQNSLAGDGTCAGAPATGGDILDYSVGYETGVEVNMAGGATAGDSAIGFENAIGTAFADVFVGNELSNTIRSGAGNDSVRSGSGDDNVRGGAGKDLVRAGSGDDDAFGGKGNDTLRGGSGDDLLVGGGGKDLCRGGAGGDTIRKCEGKSKARAETRARVARLAKLG